MRKDLVTMLATLILKRAYETDRGDLVVSVEDLRSHLGQVALDNGLVKSPYEFNKAVNMQLVQRADEWRKDL